MGNRQPQWKLDYIKQNAAFCTVRQLALALDLSDTLIYQYCALHNLVFKRDKTGPGERPIREHLRNERLRRFQEDRRLPIQRPPAVYDNKSREQIIDELLAL